MCGPGRGVTVSIFRNGRRDAANAIYDRSAAPSVRRIRFYADFTATPGKRRRFGAVWFTTVEKRTSAWCRDHPPGLATARRVFDTTTIIVATRSLCTVVFCFFFRILKGFRRLLLQALNSDLFDSKKLARARRACNTWHYYYYYYRSCRRTFSTALLLKSI